MAEAFAQLNIQDKRQSILNRMDALHDKLLSAREALNARKQNRKLKKLDLQDNAINLLVSPQSLKPSSISIGTDIKERELLPTSASEGYNNQNLTQQDISLPITNKTIQYKIRISQPVYNDKQNDSSPIKNQILFQSPEKKQPSNNYLKNNSNNSPVNMLQNRFQYDDENLLEQEENEGQKRTFYPLQIVSQNSLSSLYKQNYSNTKKQSCRSNLSAEKSVESSNPRFKLSNKYLELSGCQWESAFMEQQDVSDFDYPNKGNCLLKQISFIPSIFQKKTIYQKKKKVNKPYVEITANIRDKVAEMIKDRLKYNIEVREGNKKGKTAKQSQTQFNHLADLQKNLKQTLVKKVFTINHPKTDK